MSEIADRTKELADIAHGAVFEVLETLDHGTERNALAELHNTLVDIAEDMAFLDDMAKTLDDAWQTFRGTVSDELADRVAVPVEHLRDDLNYRIAYG